MNFESTQSGVTHKGPFGQLPKWVLTKGILKDLSKNDLKVYFALVIYADNETGNSMRTWKTIQKDTGVCFKEIGRITKRLMNFGLIKKWRHWSRVICKINREPPEFVHVVADWVVEKDKVPIGSESYSRNQNNGRFIPKFSENSNSDPLGEPIPNKSESAKSLTTKYKDV